MRRALGGAAVAVLAPTCLPAFADETEPTDPEAPAVLAECVLPEGSAGSVEATMTWLVPANDDDLDILAGRSSGVSENFQPIDPDTENVFAGGVAHCAKVTISAIDVLAPVVVDALDLQAQVTAKVVA